MTRLRLGAILGAVLPLAGCSESGTPSALERSACQNVMIGGKPYHMQVPVGADIEEDTDRGSVLIRPKPKGRLLRFVSLAPLAGLTLSPPDRSTTLANGLTFSYSVDENIGGGSAGPEAELMGELLLGPDAPVVVVCHDQAEMGLDAEWCLDSLGTIQPAASPQACK
ncbi:MAG: hypothetical protein R3D57_16970 [Hyphomicrobiaceae bacterium]